MKRYFITLMIVVGGFGMMPALAEPTQVSLAFSPVIYAEVKGDVSKFQAINGMRNNGSGGIENATLRAELDKGTVLSFEGNANPRENDLNGMFLLEKEDVGYVKLSYDAFRKYYSNRGGYFSSFLANYEQPVLSKDLDMDMGNFLFEVGKGVSSDPDIAFSYRRRTKDGSKSSTIWQSVSDGTFATSRKTGPAFIDVDDVIDELTVKGKLKIGGFNVKGDQKYIFWEGHRYREGQTLSSTPASQTYSTENIEAQTKQLTTTVRADRWSVNDKSYVAFGYRFEHLRNGQIFDILTLDSNHALQSGDSYWADATGVTDVNIWTGQFHSSLTDKLAFISGLKLELKSTRVDSEATEYDSSGTQTALNYWENKNRVTTVGESFSLRYAALPKLSLYADLEMEQERNWMWNVGNHGSYESINQVPENVGTLGARFSPMKSVNVTSEYKHGRKKAKIITVTKTDSGTDDFLYYDKIETNYDQIKSRLSWKPLRWFEGSFRYIDTAKKYRTHGTPSSGITDDTKTLGYQRDFVYGITLTPQDQWMFDLSYTMEFNKINGTPVQSVMAVPPSTSNVNSILFTASYAPTEKLSLFSAVEYSRAKNLTNESTANLTAGSSGAVFTHDLNSEWYSIDNGLKFGLKKDVTIEPHYAYQAYRSFAGVESGNYSAHVAWLDVNLKF